MKTNIFILAAASMLTLGACSVRLIDQKEVNGEMMEKTIDVKDFNALRIKNSADVIYTVSDTFSVRVKTRGGYLKNMDFQNEDSLLTIDFHQGISKNERVWNINQTYDGSCTIYISAPSLRGIRIEGAADFTCKDTIVTDAFKVSVAGAGDVEIAGIRARTVEFTLAGAGDMKALLDRVEHSDLSIAGAGDMDIAFRDCSKAGVSVAGAGDVELRGTLGTLSKNIAGVGEIDTDKLTLTGK
ncbi:MAG: DUF2807 domain-containing protein [Bacteroidales bacterium]|nr:DUF2807 domain-containing protein [Bacteroidales bacterium]MCM1147234.1 DUF2807 domain-containing protein [Bacteroidales bacterium]MCM1207201.1 DUF2807 domain-containing protein [Bacillota bacterium]MCM1509736.1 DUF2807 domain-containing protein [Clostridium sp.]